MRFITGLIVGIVLTIGTAYVVDSMHAAPGPNEKAATPMVNWSVVSENLRGLSTDVRDAWNRLLGKAKEIDKKTGT